MLLFAIKNPKIPNLFILKRAFILIVQKVECCTKSKINVEYRPKIPQCIEGNILPAFVSSLSQIMRLNRQKR